MTEPIKVRPQEQAQILMQALPHMLRYDDSIVVVKYGGHAMGDEEVARDFARDMVLLEQAGLNPVVVHGGGPQIGAMLKKLGIESHFAGGLRITDKPTMEIVEMVLAGSINKQIVGFINAEGGRAVGLCGKDGNMVRATKVTRPVHDPENNSDHEIDFGFVGEPQRVDTTVLEQILGRELIPVLAPVALGEDGETFNVNADTFAGAIAGALRAKRLLLLTDVPGVLDRSQQLIERVSLDAARRLIADGTLAGGRVPKVESAIDALEQGVDGVVSEHGLHPEAVLEFVDGMDDTPLEPNPAPGAAIEQLRGRKLILTTGTRKHAEAVMQRLAIDRHFDGVFDIIAAELEPKPQPQT